MARTDVFLQLPNGSHMHAKTDLTGHGIVRVGEEFVARERSGFGRSPLIPGGKKLLVRVLEVTKVNRSYHILRVDILQDLTAEPVEQRQMF